VNKQHTCFQSDKEVAKRSFREAEAAIYIGMSPSFLRQSRMTNHVQSKDENAGDDSDDGLKALEKRTPGPRYIRIGSRAIRYLLEDLDAWLDQWRNGRAA